MADSDWQRYREGLLIEPALGLSLDVSRIQFEPGWLGGMQEDVARAHREMDELEHGALANPSEARRVGHYWLRKPDLAPDEETRAAIVHAQEEVREFAARVHGGSVTPQTRERFTDLVHIGIGGSALGPQLVADALGGLRGDQMRAHFVDNTDPQGVARLLRQLGPRLSSALVLVASKSGKTRETQNGAHALREAFAGVNLQLEAHSVAITSEGSELDQLALTQGWLASFPVWSWVGGRTSVTSPVGHAPAALQGLDFDELLIGAAACDRVTRQTRGHGNPAMRLALAWLAASGGRDERAMVVIPYRDRLSLLSKYLQQLVMESLGKKHDLAGAVVHHGLTVYGNKGSTDQHAYVQQLREGPDNFFVTFIEVLEDSGFVREVEPGVTMGDHLRGFLYGTRDALWESGRQSITLALSRLDAFHLGVLIALYERAVGFYASLVRINAYDQPGVEAGKKAAAGFIDLQAQILGALANRDRPGTAEDIADEIDASAPVESVYHILRALAANGRCIAVGEPDPGATQFRHREET